MSSFGKRSTDNLKNVHPDLVRVLSAAVSTAGELNDFTVICGHRNKFDQEAAFRRGASKAHFGQSPHNKIPSCAIDFIPYFHDRKFTDEDWNNLPAFTRIASHIKDAARKLKVNITWGGDWKSFKDYPHIELTNWRNM